ncbi:ATP-binding cassette domain-containing protein [Candidatus Poribacteria bacterium]|nr:ATP-binding cassette domain-containing protein [Candidatus Poribacteria bacterium]
MKGLIKLLGFMKPFLWMIILAVIFTGCLTMIGMAQPLIMRRLINDVAKDGKWGIFPLVMSLLFAIPILRALVNTANSLTLKRVGLGMIARTRKRMYKHLMRLSMKFYNDTPVGNINQRLMGDVANISNVTTSGIITLLADLVAVVFAVSIMLRLNWRLSLLTFALLPFYYLNFLIFSKRIKNTNAVIRTHMDHISSMLQERLSAHELIQSYGQERNESTHFSSRAKQIMDASIRGSAYNISFGQVSAFINKLGNTLIYSAGCYYFVKGDMGYGDVLAFAAYSTQILGPVVRFSSVANQIVQVGVSIDRINEILDREPAIKEKPDAVPIEELQGDIKVDGLTFSYENDETTLENIHLDIPAGTHLAVLGTAGAGRTTLAMLLRRFYEPREGKIMVDGKSINQYNLHDYRENLAMVLPESAIFDGTIRENLCYGKPDASEEIMLQVSKGVGLHSFVEKLIHGYDTKLGTGGLKLSAGTQQRIGIARALISQPFILITDEATGSLDPESAEAVNKAIDRAMEGKTYIMIVHRALMTRDADSIAVMDEGKVVETGIHDELIVEPDSLYREIYGKQYGEKRLPKVEED